MQSLINALFNGHRWLHRTKPLVVLLFFLTACQSYSPLALKPHAVFAPLTVAARSLGGQLLPAYPLKSGQPLDITALELLAVSHNPGLVELRASTHVRQIELVAAGLLPDPVYAGGRDHPISGPDHYTAWNNSLMLDLGALIQHHTQVQAAEAEQRSIQLNLLWQEWNVLSNVRQSAYRLQADTAMLPFVHSRTDLWQYQTSVLHSAVQAHTLSRMPMLDASAQLQLAHAAELKLQQQIQKDQQQLLGILGLAPEQSLNLAPLPTIHIPSNTPNHLLQRPDLLALQAGYASADAHYRQSVLAQFPDIGIGFNDNLDTTANHTLGFALQLPLPLFGTTEANIHKAEATREQLKIAYTEHMNQAMRTIAFLRQQISWAQQQIHEHSAEQQLHCAAAHQLNQLLQQHSVDLLRYDQQQLSCIEQQISLKQWQQEIDQQQLALMTLQGIVPQWEYPDHA